MDKDNKKNNNISEEAQSLKETILEKNITPRSKIYFLMKNIFFWSLVVIAIFIVLNALIRVIAITIGGLHWMPKGIGMPLQFGIFFKLLPVIWIVLGVLGVILIRYSIRHTKKGYKIPTLIILGFNIVLLLSMGLIHYWLGPPDPLHRLINTFEAPPHERMKRIWYHPQHGRIEGTIQQVEDTTLLLDTSNYNPTNSPEEWKVDISNTPYIHPTINMEQGTVVKILGKMIGDKEFISEKILPESNPQFHPKFFSDDTFFDRDERNTRRRYGREKERRENREYKDKRRK